MRRNHLRQGSLHGYHTLQNIVICCHDHADLLSWPSRKTIFSQFAIVVLY